MKRLPTPKQQRKLKKQQALLNAKKKRPYSMKYTATRGTPRRYLLSGIPPGLWTAFEEQAKREHIAKRQVILELVEAWTHRFDTPETVAEKAAQARQIADQLSAVSEA